MSDNPREVEYAVLYFDGWFPIRRIDRDDWLRLNHKSGLRGIPIYWFADEGRPAGFWPAPDDTVAVFQRVKADVDS